MSHNRFLPSLTRGNTITEATDLLGRRRGTSSQVVCQRCNRFEADLTDTTDHLSATDAELKASRQVISLLQRQLELFQVEKEGLEKLIVSQCKNNGATVSDKQGAQVDFDLNLSDDAKGGDSRTDNLLDFELLESKEVTNLTGDTPSSPDDVQKGLLKLIKTQLYTKDEEIVKLKSSLKEAQNEKAQLDLQVHILEDDLSKMRSEISLLRENLALRDQTIVSLSNELFEQSAEGDANGSSPVASNHQRRQSSAETLLNHTAHHFRQSQSSQQNKTIHKLSDTLEAYKKTNELLSQNVLKLTDRCALLERREMESKSQAQELEARCCQIQSKLLSLLKEIEQSTTSHQQASTTTTGSEGNEAQPTTTVGSNEFIQSEPVKLLIKRLLEDKSLDIPLSWKEGNKSRARKAEIVDNAKLECDELGFYIVATNDSNGSSTMEQTSPTYRTGSRAQRARAIGAFSSKLNSVEEACESSGEDARFESIDSNKANEARWRASWDEFIKDFDKINLVKSKEFKDLLRWGVPQEYRCKIWKSLIDLRVGKERQSRGPDYFQSLLEPPSSKSSSSNSHTLKQLSSTANPSSKQIELDLLRTLPNNKYFETIDSPGTVRLRRVLIAFAVHKPDVGYCQGMNRLAAVALLVLPEEEAFWCLVSIVEKIMPVGYYNDLWLAQVDSNVVMDFVGLLMPTLADHFRQYEIELSLFAWFLTIFVDGTPPALFLRLWDCFLYEGDKIMFRVALALLKMHERELLELDSSVAVNSFLRSIVNNSVDIDQLFKVAFGSINPLPGRALRARRENHFQAMQANIKSLGNTNSTSTAMSASQAASNNHEKHIDNDCDSLNEDSSIISI